MCHFVLPENPSKRNDADALDCRYADDVIKMFGILARRHGTALCDYEAKIFGGGNMIRTADQNTENSIGTRNSAAAMQLLMQENVNILVAHVGEFGHRRVIFDTGNGEVWVKYIESGKAKPDGKGGIL
jgi:chemotaxis protein CheD